MFYICPPTGNIQLHVLENCIFSRLQYLECLYNNKTQDFKGNSEYLLENSVFDKIGHFMLRLLTSTSSDLIVNWIAKETLLFEQRLDLIFPRQLLRLFRSIQRQLKTINDNSSISNTLQNVTEFYLQPHIFQHILNNHDPFCNSITLKVKYEIVPDLVSKREVILMSGYAQIYCSQWKILLKSLFSTYLYINSTCESKNKSEIIAKDPRLKSFCNIIKRHTFAESTITRSLTIKNIGTEMFKFPLCMQNLYFNLRTKHRLSHYARFYYSLFLKESGMSLNDAILYWREEYSKPNSCNSNCTHNWQTNEHKFVYSIQHLYGHKGSRKNYKCPDCKYIQNNIPGPSYEGGCPFYNFEKEELILLLRKHLEENEIFNFIQNISMDIPEKACIKFLQMVSNKSNIDIINSPIQYYLTLNGLH